MGRDCGPDRHVGRAKLRVLRRKKRLGRRSLDGSARVHGTEAQWPAVGTAGAFNVTPFFANYRDTVAGPGVAGVDDYGDASAGESVEQCGDLVIRDHARDGFIITHNHVDRNESFV